MKAGEPPQRNCVVREPAGGVGIEIGLHHVHGHGVVGAQGHQVLKRLVALLAAKGLVMDLPGFKKIRGP